MALASSASATASRASATGCNESSGGSAVCSVSMRASSGSGGYPICRRIVNRSSCASGSGYVPSYSIGFCVASTTNGRASSYDSPSTVTCCSCMHSSSAACVFGDARLISSARRRFANTGPGRNSNSFVRWLKTLTPVTSDGRRSGVNWMRENETSSERASAFASIVFPTPGKSSSIRWPSATRQRTQSRSVSSGACTTRARLATTASIVRPASAVRRASGSLTQQLLSPIYDHGGDLVFRRLADSLLPVLPDEDDLVLRRVEADVVAGHVVEDDEVDPLGAELLARTRKAARPAVGGESDEHLPVVAAAAELAQDVRRRIERQLPGAVVLCVLVLELLARPVVGDRSGHQHDVRVPPGQDGVEHRLRGRRFDELHTCRRRDCKVRRHQRDLRTALPRLRSERDTHPPRRPVPEEADRVERLARPAGGHEHAFPAQCLALAEQVEAAREDRLRLGHAADAPFPLARVAFVGSDEL